MMQRAQPLSSSTCMVLYETLLRLGRFLPLRYLRHLFLALRTAHLFNVPPHLLFPSRSNAAARSISDQHLFERTSVGAPSLLSAAVWIYAQHLNEPLPKHLYAQHFYPTNLFWTFLGLRTALLSNEPLSTPLFGSIDRTSIERTSLDPRTTPLSNEPLCSLEVYKDKTSLRIPAPSWVPYVKSHSLEIDVSGSSQT